jgi:thiol-disulfide isomerase/thioredoxin
MSKQKIILISLLLWVSINTFGQNVFNLNGKIDEKFDNQLIMLFTFKNDSVYSVDTTTVKNGVFHFSGKEYLDDFSLLSIGNYPNEVRALDVILEKGDISVSINDSKIKGGVWQNLYQSYRDSVKIYETEIKKMFDEQGNNRIETGSPLHVKWKELGYFTVNFKRENILNLVGQKLFMDEAGKSFSEEFAYGHVNAFQIVLDAADETFKIRNQNWIKEFYEREERKAKKQNEQNNLIGQSYMDFEFQTPEGETKRLSDYIGKKNYTIIDFWASWCGPCIAEIPNLKKVYDNNEDVEIISISLDNTKKAWQRGLSRIDAPWIHLCDFQGSRSSLTESYSIKGIPFVLLLDKEGVVLNVNLRGQALNDFLEQLINSTK